MLTYRVSLLLASVVLLACPGPAVSPGSVPAAVAPQAEYFPLIPSPNAFDTIPERSDRRRLILGTCPGRCRPGPMASIHPRIQAVTWSEAQRDSGQVIARMISDSAYPKFNLQYRGAGRQDTVFWAVVRRGGAVISIFRSTTPGTPDLIKTTQVIPHEQGFFGGHSYARWVWHDEDDLAWGTCDGGACCKSPALR